MDAVGIRRTYSLHFWDALLTATMKQHAIGTRSIPRIRILTKSRG